MTRRGPMIAPVLLAAAIATSACSSDDDDAVASAPPATEPAAADAPDATPPSTIEPAPATSPSTASPTVDDDGRIIESPLTITYDGGIYVLDGDTLDVAADLPLDGFNRVAPAGDETHVVVSTSTGFRLLDATRGAMTDVDVPGEKPGHVVTHASRTILFMDSTGEAVIYDADELGDETAEPERYQSAEAHHGVTVQLDDGTIITTLGDDEHRSGAIALDADHDEIDRNEDCEGVHGEAVARGDVWDPLESTCRHASLSIL